MISPPAQTPRQRRLFGGGVATSFLQKLVDLQGSLVFALAQIYSVEGEVVGTVGLMGFKVVSEVGHSGVCASSVSQEVGGQGERGSRSSIVAASTLTSFPLTSYNSHKTSRASPSRAASRSSQLLMMVFQYDTCHAGSLTLLLISPIHLFISEHLVITCHSMSLNAMSGLEQPKYV